MTGYFLLGMVAGFAMCLGVLTGLALRRLRVRTPPEGWVFCSADFAVQARSPDHPGRVLLVRKDAHRVDCPLPLYLSGRGVTVDEAIQDACRRARAMP